RVHCRRHAAMSRRTRTMGQRHSGRDLRHLRADLPPRRRRRDRASFQTIAVISDTNYDATTILTRREADSERMGDRKTCLAIRHVAFEDLGAFAPALLQAGYELRYLDIGVDDLGSVEPAAADLMVILGGPIGVYEEER